MKQIIGDQGKRRRKYDPDLARRVNEAVRKGELETKVSEDKGTDEEIEAICRKYEEYMNGINLSTPYDLVSKLKPTKEQILKFSKKLVDYTELEFFKRYTANYLTALMHASEDDNFELDFRELNEAELVLENIGYELEGKKLTVYGDVGDGLGYHAENCTIHVSGDAEYRIGEHSKKCKITINGNAGHWAGEDAEKCEIYIEKEIGLLSEKIGEGTEIFQKQDGDWVKIRPK